MILFEKYKERDMNLINPYTFSSILKDGNTVYWIEPKNSSYVTKDVNNIVSSVQGLDGTPNFLQSTLANRPLYTSEGLVFDGVNDYLTGTHPTYQNSGAMSVYIKLKINTWSSGRYLFSSGTWFYPALLMYNTSAQIYALESSFGSSNVQVSSIYLDSNIGSWLNLKYIQPAGARGFFSINGVNSNTFNNTSEGTSNSFIIANNTFGANRQANIVVAALIVRKTVDTPENQIAISNYINSL